MKYKSKQKYASKRQKFYDLYIDMLNEKLDEILMSNDVEEEKLIKAIEEKEKLTRQK
jgi:uncharacterized protein YlbG (UPF0298 family)